MKTLARLACVLIAVSACSGEVGETAQQKIPNYDYSKMQTEQMNRGLLAIHNGGGKVSVSWRLSGAERKSYEQEDRRYRWQQPFG